jgi:hypothetical protein
LHADFGDLHADAAGAHERFADEDGVAAAPKTRYVGALFRPLTDEDDAFGDFR